MTTDFSVGALRSAAEHQAGHDDYGSDSYMAALEPLLFSIAHEMQLHDIGRQEMRRRIVTALANRLTVVAWEKRNPAAAGAPIAAPIVILGLQRTGSSILHETMAAAPGMRTPLIWEVRDYALAHRAADAGSQVAIEHIQAEIDRKNAQVPGYAAIHFEDAFTPMECVSLMVLDLVTSQFATIAWAPSYRDFLLRQDARSAYAWHRRALRYLQASGPPRQWVLKAPIHALYVDALFDAYPGARIVQTHRAPREVVGSLCSLYATLRAGWSDRVADAGDARADAAYAAAAVHRTVDYRAAHPEVEPQFLDIAFRDFMADQAGTLARIYRHGRLDFSPAAEATMLDYLAHRPRNKHGTHRYSLEQFGLSDTGVAALFYRYLARYATYC